MPSGHPRGCDDLGRVRDERVDEAVVDGLLGGEPAIAQRVGEDAVIGLPAHRSDPAQDGVADGTQIVRLEFDVGGAPADPRRPLMEEDPRVGQREALPRSSGGEDELSGGRRPPECDSDHVVRQQRDGVRDREHHRHGPAG